MPYQVLVLRSAARELAALPKSRQVNIARRIDMLSETPRPSGCEKLEGEDDLYRIRASDYRVLYRVDDAGQVVTVIKVGHRRDVYRNL